MLKALSAGAILFLFSLNHMALASGEDWSCIKDGNVIEVKGATPKAKKVLCEAAKGQWTKEKPKKQSAGSGGW